MKILPAPGVLLCAIMATGLPLGSAGAQDIQDPGTYSSDQIEQIFKKQRTRGIAAFPSAPVDGTLARAADIARETGYVAVAREDQINVRIRFDFDSDTLRADQAPKLDAFCDVMRRIDVNVFQIIGHTDSSGSADYNQSLSFRRAQAVKAHLVQNCGIDSARLLAIGVGESALLDANDPESESNRRVEFQALG